MLATRKLVLILLCFLPVNIVSSATIETVFRLNDTATPLVARQEKAQGLLTTWEFIEPLFLDQFRMNTESDMASLQSTLTHLISEAGKTTFTQVSPNADHHLVWAMARAQMVNSLDFSEYRLQRFFELNKNRYDCEPKATVSEIVITRTYTDNLGTTAILDEIDERLKKESFPRVAYHLNDRLGNPDVGYRGDVTLDQAGQNRFDLYRQVHESGRRSQGSGNPIGGPFEIPEGWVYIQVHHFVPGDTDCFSSHRGQVIQDYGREWLKKIHADTLTTALLELQPDIRPYTTGTQTSDVAFTVAGHTRTFAEARAMLPFLMGNERNPAFWESIQSQALDIELLYHSTTGRQIQDLPEYQSMRGVLQLLTEKRNQLQRELSEPATTETLHQWFLDHQHRYTTYGSVSYILFECHTTGTMSRADQARCAAALSNLRNGQWKSGEIVFKEDLVTSVPFEGRSREIQVATQSLEPGQWSEVFTEDGNLKVLRLQSIEKAVPAFSDVEANVRADYHIEYQLQFWRKVAGRAD